MTLETAFELGQFAYRLKNHGADGLYEDFMKIVEKLMRDKPSDTQDNWTIWTEPTKPSEDPLNPWNVTCEANTLKAKDMPKSDVDLTPHIVADTVTSCNSECAV